jgi:hypothetical protein
MQNECRLHVVLGLKRVISECGDDAHHQGKVKILLVLCLRPPAQYYMLYEHTPVAVAGESVVWQVVINLVRIPFHILAT